MGEPAWIGVHRHDASRPAHPGGAIPVDVPADAPSRAYAKIEDVYYLQQVQGSDPNAAPDTKIVRRGQELHEPTSRMLIPKTAILFVEDLTEGSPIAQFMQKDASR